ncbi:MAG: amidohydrolase [Proteobacteria bacterium]|nr:amidohydrolase [Pseudomonadota bacterium]
MPVVARIAQFAAAMTVWRRDLHVHPETAFQETRTAEFVAGKLESFGLRAHRGLARTGVVASLEGRRPGGRAIALRADLDGLDIQERNEFAHCSRTAGKMHACGHDGHTATLLGAARYLAETRDFQGTVHFVFQPAEENEGGGRIMVDDGLFKSFPADAVYAMHNWPGLEAGTFAVREGPIMAAYDVFEIVVKGRGAHGAMPHQGVDPVVAASSLVQALQTIASRATNPLDAVVVSTTQIHGGDTWNVIPDQVALRGTTRAFKPELQDHIEAAIKRIARGVCAAHGATEEVRYERRYPPTINASEPTAAAVRAAVAVVGETHVVHNVEPSMGADDFAFMLRVKPGCYILLGNGPRDNGRALHSSRYDFNDAILPVGASYWARLVELELAEGA